MISKLVVVEFEHRVLTKKYLVTRWKFIGITVLKIKEQIY